MNLNKVNFYSLLYIDDNETRQLGGFNRSGEEKLIIFLKCANLLSKTLILNGLNKLSLLTNNANTLNNLVKKNNLVLNCIQIDFSLNIPKDINFYTAHYKIDVFKYFSTLDGYSILLDNDVVCLDNIPPSFQYIIKHSLPIHYAIADYGRELRIKDMRVVSADVNIGAWSGGEIIGGDRIFFTKLHSKIMTLCTSYFHNYKKLFHQGDEMLTSVALDLLYQSDQLRMVDCGTIGLIKRYWSNICYNELNTWFAHLPYDKLFLSSISESCNSVVEFKQLYKRYYYTSVVPKKFIKSTLRLARRVTNK